jgi:hypothetical protein
MPTGTIGLIWRATLRDWKAPFEPIFRGKIANLSPQMFQSKKWNRVGKYGGVIHVTQILYAYIRFK